MKYLLLLLILFFPLILFTGGLAVTMDQLVEESSLLPRTPLPVKIVIVDLLEDWGTCDRVDGKRFVIEISDELDPEWATRILLHEWAHTLSWDAEEENGDHCAAWGAAYARCYRSLFPVSD